MSPQAKSIISQEGPISGRCSLVLENSLKINISEKGGSPAELSLGRQSMGPIKFSNSEPYKSEKLPRLRPVPCPQAIDNKTPNAHINEDIRKGFSRLDSQDVHTTPPQSKYNFDNFADRQRGKGEFSRNADISNCLG